MLMLYHYNIYLKEFIQMTMLDLHGVFFFSIHLVNFNVSNILISEPLATDGHLSRSAKLEDKEHKREMDGAKEKERYKEKYMGKSIQELDLSDCKRCSPSYRLLPADVYYLKLIIFLVGFVNYVVLILWNSFMPFSFCSIRFLWLVSDLTLVHKY